LAVGKVRFSVGWGFPPAVVVVGVSGAVVGVIGEVRGGGKDDGGGLVMILASPAGLCRAPEEP